jgi:hypothetical protein
MTDDEMVLAAATWLGERVHTGQRWRDIYEGTRTEFLGYARGMLTAAEAIGVHKAPVPAPKAPLGPEAMWKALVEASTS